MKFNDEEVKLPISYESLPMICYNCGKLGHFSNLVLLLIGVRNPHQHTMHPLRRLQERTLGILNQSWWRFWIRYRLPKAGFPFHRLQTLARLKLKQTLLTQLGHQSWNTSLYRPYRPWPYPKLPITRTTNMNPSQSGHRHH